MNMTPFYTPLAEGLKVGFYVLLLLLVGIGVWKKWFRPAANWANYIHAAVLLNFLVGGLYGGIRMLTTDPVEQMLIRRLFALEAWFCFACAGFYFLFLYLKGRKGDSP
jgi:hypothetical protein